MNRTLVVLIMSFLFTNVKCQDLTDGLLAYYPFSGNTNDSSTNHLDGAIHGSPILVNDRFNQSSNAYYFNGLNDYVNIPAPLLTTNSYSYVAWVKPSANDGLAYVISIGSDTAYQALLLSPFSDVGWTGGEYLSSGDNYYQSAGVAVDTSHWYHLVLTRDNSKLQLFVDGHNFGSVPVNGNPVYGNSPMANIAKRAGAADQFFKGVIDEVRIYNRVLTDTEVLQLYSQVTVQSIRPALSENIFSLYPNPTNGIFTIDLSDKLTNCSVTVRNSMGMLVYSEKFNEGFGRKEISVPNYTEGMFFVNINANEGSLMKKIMFR